MEQQDKAIYDSLDIAFYNVDKKGKRTINTTNIRKSPYLEQFKALVLKYTGNKAQLCCTGKWHGYMTALKKYYNKDVSE